MHIAHIAIDSQTKARRIQTCTEHSRSVADLAKGILAPCRLGSTGYLAGVLHDCGKFTDEFNEYITKASNDEPVRKGSVIHTFAGVRCILEQFHSQHDRSIQDIAAEILAICIGSHHGLIDLWDERHQSGFEHRLKHQPSYDHRAIAAFYEECATQGEIEQLFRMAVQEVASICQHEFTACVRNEKELYYTLGLLVRLITSALIDADRTDTRCFMQNVPHPQTPFPDWAACAAHIQTYLSEFPQKTPIQLARRTFSDQCAVAAEKSTGLYRLDLPTGGGKTLAALRFAVSHAKKNKLRRIIYAAPLLSIIEQNAAVIRSAIGDTVTLLEHHSNLVKDDPPAEETAQAELLQETWDAPLIVTTFVQMLNTLFSGKLSSVRRFHSLCESVIIIDEVQSLPPKMLSMFNCAINFLVKCCRASVVLCSATQPAFDQAVHKMLPCERLIDEKLFRQYAPLFQRTTIRNAGRHSIEELAELSTETLQAADNLLIVCNTKREAAELFQSLKSSTDAHLFHLSAGMCMAHRKQVLAELSAALERKEKLICVSTQLIEAGVDISFGSVIRLSAGLDNIVQSAGRCNRHGEHMKPQPVHICELKNEELGALREIREAQIALTSLLEEYRRHPERYENDLSSDAAVRDYYTFLYRSLPVGAQDYPLQGQKLFELLSTNDAFMPDQSPPYTLNQAFRTAGSLFEVFDSTCESIIVPFQQGVDLIDQLSSHQADHDIAYAADLLQHAKSYSVSVSGNQIERMKALGMIYTLLDGHVYVLNSEYYDDQIGIKEGNDLCSTLIL